MEGMAFFLTDMAMFDMQLQSSYQIP